MALAYHVTGVSEDGDPTFTQANRLYKALTNGTPLLPENPLYSTIYAKVSAADLAGAAQVITHPTTGAREFYDVLVAGIPQHWNRDDNPIGDRHELSAMFLGNTRDGRPFRNLFTEDWVYFDNTISGNNAYTANPNNHFRTVFDTKSARDALDGDYRPGFNGTGIFTSSTWFYNYIDMGTNRRPIYGMLHHLFCTEIQPVQSLFIPDTYVKRDVPRTPAGDVNQYLTNCIGCHSFMDALIPRAFARFDTDPAQNPPTMLYVPPRDKNNEVNFANEAITSDEWHLFLTDEQNAIFGFNGLPGNPLQEYGSTNLRYLNGRGLKQFGELMAESDGLYTCMAKQLVTRIYLKKQFTLATLTAEDKEELVKQASVIEGFARLLKKTQNLREVIEAIAVYFVGGGA